MLDIKTLETGLWDAACSIRGAADATSGPLGGPGDGRAVACADYDNDNDLDIYIVNGANIPNKLFRNEGGGVFVDQAPPWSTYGLRLTSSSGRASGREA